MRWYVGQPLSLFGPALFCARDLLMVQPDAWDRYAERATLCFELGCLVAVGQTAESKFAPRGARLARFAAVATVGEAFSQLC